VRDEATLLASEDIRQLERLSLRALESVRVGLAGQREGPTRGVGVEFADYRPYTHGDDLRRIDWNVYGRLRELLVKTSPIEAHVWLSVLVDASRSMDQGNPNKLHYARRLAALLGAVALMHGDAVQVQVLSDGASVAGGRLDAAGLLRTLTAEVAALPAGRQTQLESSMRRARATGDHAEVAVLISDGLTAPGDLEGALMELAQAARSSAFVHVVDEGEGDAGVSGVAQLSDSETGERLEVAITDQTRMRYRERYREFRQGVEAACRSAGVGYLTARASVDALEFVIASAREGSILRGRSGSQTFHA
jgi:uncharacterized protein (DUF58 family)